jgi:hypothetical protein
MKFRQSSKEDSLKMIIFSTLSNGLAGPMKITLGNLLKTFLALLKPKQWYKNSTNHRTKRENGAQTMKIKKIHLMSRP